MTKEELKQEAEQDAGNASGLDLSTVLIVAKDKTDAYRLGRFDGYISSAEPREKRIAELEKENAELKKKYEKMFTIAHNRGMFVISAMRENRIFEEQLAKAKDHIKKLLDCLKQDTNDPQTNYYVCQYMDKAEQFLSEVEK